MKGIFGGAFAETLGAISKFFLNPIKLMHVEKTPLGITLVVLFGGSRLAPGSRGDALSRSQMFCIKNVLWEINAPNPAS